MVPKIGVTLFEGADGTAGLVVGSLAAAKRQKMAGEYKVSTNFGAILSRNPACGKGNGPVGADGALAPLNIGMAADATKTAKPMAPLNVRRPADMAKAADLILSDNDDGLSDLKTAPADKQTAKPIVAPPPYKGQDPDIHGRNGLNGINGLDELQGGLA